MRFEKADPLERIADILKEFSHYLATLAAGVDNEDIAGDDYPGIDEGGAVVTLTDGTRYGDDHTGRTSINIRAYLPTGVLFTRIKWEVVDTTDTTEELEAVEQAKIFIPWQRVESVHIIEAKE